MKTKTFKLKNPHDEELPYPFYEELNNCLLNSLLDKMAAYIDKIPGKVYLWCRGSSGIFMSSSVFTRIKKSKKQVFIRYIHKDGESSHSRSVDHKYDSSDKHIIIDDFISSGNTIDNIYKTMKINFGIHEISCILTGSDPASVLRIVNMAVYSDLRNDTVEITQTSF